MDADTAQASGLLGRSAHLSLRRVGRGAALALLALAGAAAAGDGTARVSTSTRQGDGLSEENAISGSGRFLAFSSLARNLVADDTNGVSDVFVRDTKAGSTTRVSVDSAGAQADAASTQPVISGNGRFVAFTSQATNLVAGDTNGLADVFVHDRKTGDTTRVSVDSAGAQADAASSMPAISGDGRFVAFVSQATNLVADDTNGVADVFVHDTKTGLTTRVSVGSDGAQADAASSAPALSGNGRFVAFASDAANLVAGDTNDVCDLFVHDRTTGITTRVSVDSAGAQADGISEEPSISTDGRYVAFASAATNLVAGDTNGVLDAFVHDRKTGGTTRVSVASDGGQGDDLTYSVAISGNGRIVAFYSEGGDLVADDTNGKGDVFLHDRKTGITARASVRSDGGEANGVSYLPSISSSGRLVAFYCTAKDLVPDDVNGVRDVFVRDTQKGVTSRGSVGALGVQADDGTASDGSAISADGRFVAFAAQATNLVAGDTNDATDVFVHDRATGSTERVSVDSAGVQGDSTSKQPSISADGRFVAFVSDAANLVAGDTNGEGDVFVHDRTTGSTTRVSVDSDGGEGDARSDDASISADGRWVAFASDATNLVPGDDNGVSDIFVHDRKTGITTRVSVDSAGGAADADCYEPSISGNGRFVAFTTGATNLVAGDGNGADDIFVHDLKTGITTRVSLTDAGAEADSSSYEPSISANGRFVAFTTEATNLVPGDLNGVSDVFVHDRKTGHVTRASVDDGGVQALGGDSVEPSISANGRYVAFRSGATNLVPGDTNGGSDAFVHDRKTGRTTLASVDSEGAQANTPSDSFALSADGRWVVFTSSATNLVPNDDNEESDAFVAAVTW